MTLAKFINSVLLGLTVLAFAAQFFIDFSTDNIAANSIIFISTAGTLLYFRWTRALDTHPLSSFAILGFCVTSELGALFAQSVAATAVGTSLHQPLVTFSMLSMYQIIVLVAHALYRTITTSSSMAKPGLLRHMFRKLGVYDMPSVAVVWMMGGMGGFFLLLSRFSPVAKGLSFLAWTPFLIPIFLQQAGPAYCNAKRNYLVLLVHAALIAVVAIMFNTREMLLAGIATVALLLLMIGMRSTKPLTPPMLFKLGAMLLLGLALSWPASNMVTAMAVARDGRDKASAYQMVTKTLENFKDPEKLEIYRKQALGRDLQTRYDEKYVDNPMLARFVITKFHDNAMYFAGRLSDKGADDVWNISGDFFWTILPQPLLDALKIDVDKDKLQFSMGDVLAHYAVGTPLSGERTGSLFGHGWALFGALFPVVYFGMCFILFAALDLFSMRAASGVTVMSVIGMLNIWPNFLFGITADSLHHLFINVARGVLQSAILYAIVFYAAKSMSNLVLNVKPARASALALR